MNVKIYLQSTSPAYLEYLKNKKIFLNETKKATVFKSLRINCWEINQVTSKCQTDFFGQNFQKKWSKTEKENVTIKFYIFEIF